MRIFIGLFRSRYKPSIEGGRSVYKIKIVDFDSKTNVKQATLREIIWTEFESKGKPPIYESNIVEIFGESDEQVNQAFLNNGIKFYPPVKNNEKEDGLDSEIVTEIGNKQVFEHTQYKNIDLLEQMMTVYDYKLNDLIPQNGAILIIHTPVHFKEKYSRFYMEITKALVNDVRLFLFLSCTSTPQILTHEFIAKEEYSSLEYVRRLWKAWGVETSALERIDECLCFNIMI